MIVFNGPSERSFKLNKSKENKSQQVFLKLLALAYQASIIKMERIQYNPLSNISDRFVSIGIDS